MSIYKERTRKMQGPDSFVRICQKFGNSGSGSGGVYCTLKPQYNDPFNNKIPAIKNLILSPSVVNFIVKRPSNNKIRVIKDKIFGPFRFVKPRFAFIDTIVSLATARMGGG